MQFYADDSMSVDKRKTEGEDKAKMTRKRTPRIPPGIQRHGKDGNRWRVRIYVDGVQKHVGIYNTLSDARYAQQKAQSEALRGQFLTPQEQAKRRRELKALEEAKSVTFQDVAESWLSHLKQSGRAASTIVTHRSTLNVHLTPVLGDIPIAGITPGMIQDLLDNIETEIPRRNAARTLQTLLNYAVQTEAGGLTASPFKATIARPKPPKGRIDREKIATPDEVEALTAQMPTNLRLAVPLAAWCCLRLGEVLGLARGDLMNLDDPQQATLRVDRQVNAKANDITPPKSDSYRTVAIPGFMLPMIEEHLADFVDQLPSAPLFPGNGVGGRVSQSAFDRQWRAARKKVKPGFKFHDLRHSGLTHFAQAGATLAELMLRGGHTDVSVALRYQTATAERDRALTDIMENMLTKDNGRGSND